MNDMLVNIITNIIYIAAILIVVILVLALINYILYTIYSIKEIIVHNTFEDAIHYKLKDIYNYKLINYINTINADTNYKYDISSEFSSEKIIDMKEFKLIKISQGSSKYIDLTYLKDFKTEGDITTLFKLKLKNIDALKLDDFKILYDKISIDIYKIPEADLIVKYIDNNNTYYYKIEYELKDYNEYLKNNNIDININKSLYSDIVSFSKNDTTTIPSTTAVETNKKIIAKDGIIILYKDVNNNNNIEKVRNNTDIYGYILNGLFLLIPTTLLWSNDKYSTGLYVKTNNDFYEIILLLLFIIIIIILFALINDFYTYIFNIAKNAKIEEELFIAKIMDKNIHLVVISLCIIIYCIIHSTIYFFTFISGTYKKIKAMYADLIVADEYIRNDVNKYLIANNFNSDAIIETFNDIAYGGDISYVKGKYNVIDGTTNQDIYDIKKKFEEKMIAINYSFNYDENIYNTNIYTNTFFTKMKNIIYQTQYKEGNIKYPEDKINKTLLLVLIIYLYFVKNNIDDPYILIKLNKLIFGRVANIGIPEIDEEIHNTLTLRSLLGHNLENKAIIDDLEYETKLIFDNIENNENENVKKKIKNYNTDVKKNVLDFSNKLYDVELDYWGAVYFFNLYLVLEIMLGCFVILAILLIIKYTDNDMRENVERYIDKMNELIKQMMDEIKSAILGVV
jgi:hypothetical protein